METWVGKCVHLTANLILAGLVANLFSAWVWGQPTPAPDWGWKQWDTHASQLIAQGNFLQAEAACETALKKAEMSAEAMSIVPGLLNELACVYNQLGKTWESERAFLRSIHMIEAAYGPHHPLLFQPLVNLAAAYAEWGQFDRAERVLQKLGNLKISHDASSGGKTVVRPLLMAASVAHGRKRYAEAETMYRRALAIAERNMDGLQAIAASILSNLGLLCFQTGRFEEALALDLRAISAMESALGNTHPDLVVPLVNLAQVLARLRRPNDAQPVLERALAIAAAGLGTENSLYGRALFDYAVVLRQLKRKDEAKAAERRSTEILAKTAVADPRRHTVDISELRRAAK